MQTVTPMSMQPPGRAKSSFFHDQPRPRRGINSCPAGTCGHEAPAGAGAGSKRSLGQPELLEQAAPGQRGRAERRESVACHWPGPWVWRLCFCFGGSSLRRKMRFEEQTLRMNRFSRLGAGGLWSCPHGLYDLRLSPRVSWAGLRRGRVPITIKVHSLRCGRSPWPGWPEPLFRYCSKR